MDKSAPWSAHVAIAFNVMLKPSKIQSRLLVSPFRYRVAQSALPRNSPQEASVAQSARCRRLVAARGQLPVFRLRQTHLKRICVQGRLLEVKRYMERGKCNCGQSRKSVDLLK